MAIAHVTLATRDLRRSVAFFEATLEWRSIDRPGNVPMPSAWLAIAPDQELHLLEVPNFEASPFENEYGRHIAVACPQANFPALKERLEQHGAKLIPADRPTPFERFFFRDPNGYVFEVVAEERSPER